MLVNNLIDNALKYGAKDLSVIVLLSETANKIIFQVKDHGKGIPHEEREKIFNKFYRIGNSATKAAKGTGLGLYLTKRIVKQHHADISVTDNTPTGAIFTVTLNSSTENS